MRARWWPCHSMQNHIVYKGTNVKAGVYVREWPLDKAPGSERVGHTEAHADAGHDVEDVMPPEHHPRQADGDGPQVHGVHVRLGMGVGVGSGGTRWVLAAASGGAGSGFIGARQRTNRRHTQLGRQRSEHHATGRVSRWKGKAVNADGHEHVVLGKCGEWGRFKKRTGPAMTRKRSRVANVHPAPRAYPRCIAGAAAERRP